jgi:hypothetical protein
MGKVAHPNGGNSGNGEEMVLTPGGPRAKSQVHLVNPTQQPTDQLVLTPGGWRPSSQVHLIEADHHVDASNGRLRKIHTASGKEVADFGEVVIKNDGKPNHPRNVFVPDDKKVHATAGSEVPSFGTGWITNSGWTNNSGHPLTSFSSQWAVPAPPVTHSGQIIYLFNGVQNSAYILQPVLQWGSTPAGGGNYWAITNWYVNGQGGVALHGPLVNVNPGTILTGVMTQTGVTGSNYNYLSSFAGYPSANLQVNNIQQLTWLNETLEVYGITQASDYPATSDVSFKNISILCGSIHPSVTWDAENRVGDVGQHCEIVSNSSTSGEVNLYFRGIFMGWKGMDADQRLWYSEFGGGNWVPQQTIGGVASSVGPTLAKFNGKTYFAWKGMNNDERIWFSYFDGNVWTPQQTVPGVATSNRPNLAVFNGKLYMVWKGMDADQRIWFSSFDGTNWAAQQSVPGVSTSVGASIAVFNGKLYMTWKGMDADQRIWFSAFNGTSWAAQQVVPGVGTNGQPSVAAFNGKLYMAWRGENADQTLWFTSFDGTTWASQTSFAGASLYGPSIAAYGSTLYMAWKGMNNDERIWFSTFNGSSWAAQQVVPGVATLIGPNLCSL